MDHEAASHKMCNVTHSLLSIGQDAMRLPFAKCGMSLTNWKDVMQFHFTKCAMSLTDCWSYQTAFHKMCNHVTHSLLVIRKDVMRLPFTKCAMSLTNCWWEDKMWWDCLSQNVQCHSLPVGHRRRCDETAFHKMHNVTHSLSVIGKDVMRLPSTKSLILLTSYQS